MIGGKWIDNFDYLFINFIFWIKLTIDLHLLNRDNRYINSKTIISWISQRSIIERISKWINILWARYKSDLNESPYPGNRHIWAMDTNLHRLPVQHLNKKIVGNRIRYRIVVIIFGKRRFRSSNNIAKIFWEKIIAVEIVEFKANELQDKNGDANWNIVLQKKSHDNWTFDFARL